MANSSRSQMAEGFARHVASEGTEVYSAGSAPAIVNPLAVRAMQEVGIDITEHRSKSVDEIPKDRIGLVVTLCAEEVCPVFPGEVKRLHLPFEDPAAATGTDEERLEAFRRVRDALSKRIRELLTSLPGPG